MVRDVIMETNSCLQLLLRFNVAITRAKALLIVVGNPFLLCMDHCWRNLIQFAKENGEKKAWVEVLHFWSLVACKQCDQMIWSNFAETCQKFRLSSIRSMKKAYIRVFMHCFLIILFKKWEKVSSALREAIRGGPMLLLKPTTQLFCVEIEL